MGLEDREELFVGGEGLALQDPSVCLIDDAIGELDVVLDLDEEPGDAQGRIETEPSLDRVSGATHGAGVFNHLAGDLEEPAVGRSELGVPLDRAHPVQGLHAAACRAGAVSEPRGQVGNLLQHRLDQAGQDAHPVPGELGIGRQVDVVSTIVVSTRNWCRLRPRGPRLPSPPLG